MIWSDRDPPDTLGVGGVDSGVPLAAHQPGLLSQVAPASEGWPGVGEVGGTRGLRLNSQSFIKP